MKIHELKSKLDFYIDEIYEKGYSLGYESALEEFEHYADSLWNQDLKHEGETLRMVIASIRKSGQIENL